MPEKMTKHRKLSQEQFEFSVTWLDFVPPILVKIFKWLDYALFGKDVSESEKFAQLIALLLVLSSFTLGLLLSRLPEVVSSVIYLMAKRDYAVTLTESAYQKAYGVQVTDWYNKAVAVGEVRLAPKVYNGRAVLGVQDVEEDENLFDITPEQEDNENVPQTYNYNNPADSLVQRDNTLIVTLGSSVEDVASYYSYWY